MGKPLLPYTDIMTCDFRRRKKGRSEKRSRVRRESERKRIGEKDKSSCQQKHDRRAGKGGQKKKQGHKGGEMKRAASSKNGQKGRGEKKPRFPYFF
jgi:hypothetical protein